MASAIEQEQRNKLNAMRNRQAVRAPRLEPQNTPQPEQEEQQQSMISKMRLALLKSRANQSVKQKLNQKGGAAAGAWAGGFIGSAIPFLGTTIGAFIGRFIGKKLGVIGIVIITLLSLTVLFIGTILLFMLIFKGYCDTWTGWAVDKVTLGMCQSVGSLQNVK
ncbi:MAG: hypothetical protein ABIP54_00600 [Candidatus Andersenbacteria bacterium]